MENKVNTIEEYLDVILAKSSDEPKQSKSLEIMYRITGVAKMQNPIVGKENAIRRFNILTNSMFVGDAEVTKVNKNLYPTEYTVVVVKDCGCDLLYDILEKGFDTKNDLTAPLFDNCKIIEEKGFHVNVGSVKIPFVYNKVLVTFRFNSFKLQIEIVPILKTNITIYDIRHKYEVIISTLNLAADKVLETLKAKSIVKHLIINTHEID